MPLNQFGPIGADAHGSIYDWSQWCTVIPAGPERERRRILLHARTAIGNSGNIAQQLTRLMVWVGSRLVHEAVRTPIEEPIEILRTRKGWCDQQCKAFGFLARHLLGVHVRLVSAKHSDAIEGHTMAEAYYDDAWHLFDVHTDHSVVYRASNGRILSYEEVRTQPQIVDKEYHFKGTFCYYFQESDPWTWPWPTKPTLLRPSRAAASSALCIFIATISSLMTSMAQELESLLVI
jgi:hypothetical protein